MVDDDAGLPLPLALIPAEFSGHARVVGCPYCMAALMMVLDEDGRGAAPLEVHRWDLAESPSPGRWNVKGGWIHAARHRCGPASLTSVPGRC